MLQLVGGKCSYRVCRLRHALIDPEVIKVKGQSSRSCCYQNALTVDMNAQAYSFLVLSEQSELSLVVIMVNWDVRCKATHFAATATYHVTYHI